MCAGVAIVNRHRLPKGRFGFALTVLATSVEAFFPPVETARGAGDAGWEALGPLTASGTARAPGGSRASPTR